MQPSRESAHLPRARPAVAARDGHVAVGALRLGFVVVLRHTTPQTSQYRYWYPSQLTHLNGAGVDAAELNHVRRESLHLPQVRKREHTAASHALHVSLQRIERARDAPALERR